MAGVIWFCFALQMTGSFLSDCFSQAGMSLETKGIGTDCDIHNCYLNPFPCPCEWPVGNQGPGIPGKRVEMLQHRLTGEKANAAADLLYMLKRVMGLF